MESSSERNARHLDYNRQVALTEKAHELGIHSQLLGYPQMTAEQRNAVSPQISLLAKELYSNVKLVERYLLPPFMVLERPPYSYIGGAAAAAAAAAEAPLPMGWAKQIDPASGTPFYVHAATGQSQWELPTAESNAAAKCAYSAYGAYGVYPRPAAEANPSSLVARFQAQKHTCRRYIARLKIATDELERVKEENARLEKENATLVELLPGRGGSRKRNTMRGSTRRKRH